MSIPMKRDPRHVWPDDAPPGTFDVRRCGLAGRPVVTGHIIFICPKGRVCNVYLAPAFDARPHKDAPNVWGWNGSEDRPTLSPSINCEQATDEDGKQTGGCGWHGHIQDGELRG